MNAPVPAPSVGPKRRRRRNNSASTLPPALAHGNDITRAARMGIDISYMTPGERCKYPSKFCCNIRARKTTGKLHRFCEDHRWRANVNQKRWNEVRRSQDPTHSLQPAAGLTSVQSEEDAVEVDWAASGSIDEDQFTGMLMIASESFTGDVDPMSCGPSLVDELRDDEIDALVAMLITGEYPLAEFPESGAHPVWPWQSPSPAEFPAEAFGQYETEELYSL